MKKKYEDLPVWEIVIDEDDDASGIRLVSLVDDPAIEMKGVYFSKEATFNMEFKAEKDKQIIVGPALIPNKKIKRKDESGNYYWNVFRADTIVKLVEKFNRRGDNRRVNIDHSNKLVDGFIKESWIVEDAYYDKSRLYGFNVPVGTWMVAVKVDDTDFWNKEVKEEGKFGFSIEGLLGERPMEMSSIEMAESYTDYPEGATSNAKKAIEWAEKNGWGDCGTAVGKTRARQLANREPISRDTIARMAAFKRHQQNKDVPYSEGCGGLMWDAWGGDAGINWAARKLKEIDSKEMSSIIDDLTNDEVLDLLNMEFKTIYGNTRTRNNTIKSSNLWKFKYDDEMGELVLRFNNGETYTYYSVPPDVFNAIREGDGVCDTEGENQWGRWFVGKTPSVGAAIHEILIGGGFAYTKGGSV